MNGIVQYSLYHWLIPLALILSRSIHLVLNDKTLFFLCVCVCD